MSDDKKLYDLTRRKVLGSLGALGVGAALGGAGTAAFFSDEETFADNQLVAGSLDLKVDWTEHYNGEMVEQVPDGGLQTLDEIAADPGNVTAVEHETYRNQFADVPDDLDAPVIGIDDVKPGDWGEVTFSLHLFDNPGYIWMNGELIEADENGVNEPESKAEGEVEGVVELLDEIRTSLWYDADCDNEMDQAETVIFEDLSLRSALEYLSTEDGLGVPLDGAPANGNGGNGTPIVGPGTCSVESTYDTVHVSGDEVTVDGETHEIGFNPKCQDFGLEEVIKIGGGETGGPLPGDGNSETYTTPYGDITVTQEGQTFKWSTDGFCMSKVIVKGGNQGANVYSYDNDDEDDNFDNDEDPELSIGETDAWLQTPTGQDISHVSFCVDLGPVEDGNGGNGRECFPNSTTQCLGFKWWLPYEVGNEVQTDRVTFDLGFYTEQCRHNDGSGMVQNGNNSTPT